MWAPLYITILFQFNFIECNCRPPWITMGDIEYIARYYWTLTSAARSFCEAANFKSASCIFISWVYNNKNVRGVTTQFILSAQTRHATYSTLFLLFVYQSLICQFLTLIYMCVHVIIKYRACKVQIMFEF